MHSEKFHVLRITLNAFCHKPDTLALRSMADNAFYAKIHVAAQYRQKLDFHFFADSSFCGQILRAVFRSVSDRQERCSEYAKTVHRLRSSDRQVISTPQAVQTPVSSAPSGGGHRRQQGATWWQLSSPSAASHGGRRRE